MRKQNSDFQTGFISEAGNQLKNNDYFGYVELDEYACYVIADGITDLPDAQGAKLAIETAILYFQLKPSISKRTLKKLLREANKALLKKEGDKRQKASITVVVTDYQKIRYGYVGNTRLRMYRGGSVYRQTKDMSLSQDMADQEQIPKDEVMRHEERNNLYSYLGQKSFHPYISKKIKLLETDILTLYTRGIWENVDASELDDVFSEAENEPFESLNDVEELLLSRQPENLENYTFAAIFINKIFKDPERKRRIKKVIIISVVVLIAALIAGTIIWFLYRKKAERIENMNYHFTNTIEYVNTGNYVRAKEECDQAQELSEKLKDSSMRKRLQEYMFVIETVLLADESYSAKDYESAEDYFLAAKDRARYADNIGTGYMEDKLNQISAYMAVKDYLELGDTLLENGNFEGAEEKYMLAKDTAASVHDTEGKQSAMDAMEELYQQWSEAKSQEQQEASDKAGEEIKAAEMVASGDKACMENDFVGAKVFYTMAVSKYAELSDSESQQMVKDKITAVDQKIQELEEKKDAASTYESQGEACRESGDYWGAKSKYLLAKTIYQELASDEEVERIKNIISELDILIGQALG